MDRVKKSIRLPIAVASAVQKQAEIRGISQYALLELCVHQGLAMLINEENSGKVLNDIATQVGSIGASLKHLSHLCERSLWVSCSGYAFARLAASSHKIDEAKINQEIQQAFKRQLDLAGGYDEQ